jgi:tetratricopeptide (TPR) repeat protein
MISRLLLVCLAGILAACGNGNSPAPDNAPENRQADDPDNKPGTEPGGEPEVPREAAYPYQVNAELAKVYLKYNITDEAIRLFDLAITQQRTQTNTEDAENWIGLGDALKNAGRTDEARLSYQRALQILEHVLANAKDNQQHNFIIGRIAAVCNVLGLKDKRLDYLSKLKADTDNANQQLELAAIFRQVGNAEKAEVHYQRALELTQEDPAAGAVVRVAYGDMLFALERYEEALPLAKAAAEAEGADDKTRKAARRLLFELYEARGESDKLEFKE